MSRCEIIPFIQQGLNYILDKKKIEDIICLYKLSVLIKNNCNEDFIKLFALKYIDYYVGCFEFIKGIENMTDNNIGEIKTIMINSYDIAYNHMKKNDDYSKKYYERRESFMNLSIEDFRKYIIEELLSGIHTIQENIESLKEIADSIDYCERDRLEKIDIDFEISKVKEKLINKYTEEGNFEADENVLNIVINNLNKKGYTSNHLHIYVYESLDKAIMKIFREKGKNYQKKY